jgi:thymidylate synthase
MIVSAWNPNQLHQMALPPCHLLFQVVVTGENADILNLNWTQRSVDCFLGLPFNIASYALLLKLLAAESGMKEGKLCGMLGDVHIYENHRTQIATQILRDPFPLPSVELIDFKGIFDWTHQDVSLKNYKSHPSIKGEVAV